jgi:alanyl-tRNA synthetase
MEPEDVSASAIVEKLAEKWGIRGGGASDIAQMGSRELVDKGEDEVREELLEILDELSKKS